MYKKLINWLKGKKEEDADYQDWEAAYRELAEDCFNDRKVFSDFKTKLEKRNYLLRWKDVIKEQKVLEKVFRHNCTYILYRVVEEIRMNENVSFIIQMQYPYDEYELFVRLFTDSDEEYAENCAREALEYLTKEI